MSNSEKLIHLPTELILEILSKLNIPEIINICSIHPVLSQIFKKNKLYIIRNVLKNKGYKGNIDLDTFYQFYQIDHNLNININNIVQAFDRNYFNLVKYFEDNSFKIFIVHYEGEPYRITEPGKYQYVYTSKEFENKKDAISFMSDHDYQRLHLYHSNDLDTLIYFGSNYEKDPWYRIFANKKIAMELYNELKKLF